MEKIALIIGHNSRSKGAYSTILGYEYDYWKRIASIIKKKNSIWKNGPQFKE